MSPTVRVARWLGFGLLLLGYPVLAHYTLMNVQNGQLGAVVAVAPVLVIGLIYAWKSSPRWVWLSVFTLAGVAAGASWTLLEHHFGVLYWLQDAGMQCVLFMTFGRTLLAGRQPLCTHFAEMAHGVITPQHAHYARQVTWAWAFFFGLMATVSTLLFFLSPLTVWSVFANFLTLPLVALMFILEFGVRRMVLPERGNSHILDSLRVWKDHSNPVNRTQPAE
ncbi:MAG: hypothetical protein Q7T78_08130 [Rhodoferax sp.]|nr:hypothetical protein [Rhodoferax sp.]